MHVNGLLCLQPEAKPVIGTGSVKPASRG